MIVIAQKMKYFYLLGFLLIGLGCTKEQRQRNPYLPEAHFKEVINMNLPLYNKLKNPLSYIEITREGIGLRGIIVINTGNSFMAWEKACPNVPLSDCSIMEIMDNISVKCPCNQSVYSLINGAPISGEAHYSLLNYRVSQNGTILTIEN